MSHALLPSLGQRDQSGFTNPVLILTCLLVGVLSLTGCGHLRNWRNQGQDPWASQPCQLPPNPTVHDVVHHVNTNVDRLHSWRATRAEFKSSEFPIKLPGHIAVQQGGHLRLVVTSVGGRTEFDMGSNPDVFWMASPWMKEHPYVYCQHQDFELVQQQLVVPFEPEWLMQVLGVEPFSVDGTEMTFDSERRLAKLATTTPGPNGELFRREMVVEACHGRILEHALYDGRGHCLAKANLSNHRRDPKSGALLAHRFELQAPATNQSLTITIPEYEVNPNGLPPGMWVMPQSPVGQPEDLAAALRRNAAPRLPTPPSRDIGRVALDPALSSPSDDPFEPQDGPEFASPAPAGRIARPQPQWSHEAPLFEE